MDRIRKGNETMANIKFIKIYTPIREEWCDIAYEKDGYITKVCSYTTDEMPKTARKWLEGKVGRKQYDKTLEREETIYE